MTEKKKVNDGTLLGRLHDKDYSTLKDEFEGVIAKKIHNKILVSKDQILNKAREGKE